VEFNTGMKIPFYVDKLIIHFVIILKIATITSLLFLFDCRKSSLYQNAKLQKSKSGYCKTWRSNYEATGMN
jgi:hypothetical protein